MNRAHPVQLGTWLLILINLLMAFGSIWIFMRMAPAIQVIIEKNEVSLHACEEMMAAMLQVSSEDGTVSEAKMAFQAGLEHARANITEEAEPLVIQNISALYEHAFAGESKAFQQTVDAIITLGAMNREAMRKADVKAQQLGHAGAWGVVFMAVFSFLVGMIFLRSLRMNLLDPLQEIYQVVRAVQQGDIYRRCGGTTSSAAIKKTYAALNDFLDKNYSETEVARRLEEKF